MQRRENLLYVGIDLHKETHTAVMVNCWNEKLEVVVIENKPSEFKKFIEKISRKSCILGLHPVFYNYYVPKIGEGKTKSQALVCIMRRLVNIVYGMMKNKTEYREPITEEGQ
ncbi:hypothetical protein [Lacrimispora sp.]|uniref:hypothetical protein n=1 Tax=Lacrimispora sp. TaxID=2719234 RepID=UPI003FA53052